ncbi:MAG: type II CAAX endopeptidase family protein [Firmicutes bacterium]|nr:type II CAAX endopeptidase family protein [Bacillota bacterium]
MDIKNKKERTRMIKTNAFWIKSFFLFCSIKALFILCVKVTMLLFDDATCASFAKSFLFDSGLIILALIMLSKYHFRISQKGKPNLDLIMKGIGALLICQIMCAIIFGGNDKGLLWDAFSQYKFITFILVVFLGPIAEELFFRGVVLNLLKKENAYFSMMPIILSSLIFAIMHNELQSCMYNFFAGCIFAAIYEKRGVICDNMICHSLMNFFVLIIQMYI